MVVSRKRGIFEKTDTEIKLPANLKIQVWDHDVFSSDDFLGTSTINLSNCPVPASASNKCKLTNSSKKINLFIDRKIHGWFPIYNSMLEGELEQSVSLSLIKSSKC